MTKDYAKKRPYNPRRKRNLRKKDLRFSHHQTKAPWLWLLAGLGFGIAIGSFIWWKSHAPIKVASSQKQGAPVENRQDSLTSEEENDTKDKSNPSRFDFYTLLPDMTVELPEETQAAKQAPVVDANPTQYIIQAGTFQKASEAEQLKANLALQGIESTIQPLTEKNKTVGYQVNIGPFDQQITAAKAQQKLEKSFALNSLIQRVNV